MMTMNARKSICGNCLVPLGPSFKDLKIKDCLILQALAQALRPAAEDFLPPIVEARLVGMGRKL